MSGVTDADAGAAMQLVDDWDLAEDEGYLRLAQRIAAALAEEREKARASFLVILDVEPDIQPLWEFERGVLRGIEMTKEAIRRAAEADA